VNYCHHCGDRWPSATAHDCWVLAKTGTQEMLPAPKPSDYVPLGRRVKTDREWSATHGK